MWSYSFLTFRLTKPHTSPSSDDDSPTNGTARNQGQVQFLEGMLSLLWSFSNWRRHGKEHSLQDHLHEKIMTTRLANNWFTCLIRDTHKPRFSLSSSQRKKRGSITETQLWLALLVWTGQNDYISYIFIHIWLKEVNVKRENYHSLSETKMGMLFLKQQTGCGQVS